MRTRRPTITQTMKMAIARRYGVSPGEEAWIACAYCPAPILIAWGDPERVRFLDTSRRPMPELDHVVALVNGGAHDVSNIVPACMRCNRSKCARDLDPSLANVLANAWQVPGQIA